MKTHPFKMTFYFWLSKWHGRLGWAVLGLNLLALAVRANPGEIHSRAAAHLIAALALLGDLAWLVWCSWFHVPGRAVWLRAASTLGAGRQWASSGWRQVGLTLAAAAALVWFFHAVILGESAAMRFPGSFFSEPFDLWLPTLVFAALGAVLWSASRGRKRIVIHAFTDYSGQDSLKPVVAGLPQQLQAELGAIAQLHQQLGTDPSDLTSAASAERFESGPPTYDTAGAGASFQEIVSAESQLKLGPLALPLAPLVRMVAGLWKARQITGCVRRNGDQFTIEATMRDGRRQRQWRIRQDELPEQPVTAAVPGPGATPSVVLARMTEQLACQIFTDVEREILDSSSWRAVAEIIQGWKQLANVPLDQSRKSQLLRLAEKHFIRALKEDRKFALGYYNLGVIYYQLERHEMARVAFRQAAIQHPQSPQLLVALARTERLLGDAAMLARNPAVARRHHAQAVRICDQALSFDPRHARSWNLKGLCLAKLMTDQPGADLAAAAYFNLATALSWQRLCREQLQRHTNKPATLESAKLHCGNVAASRCQCGPVNQAIRLDPTDAESHFQKGDILRRRHQFKRAAAAFERAALLQDHPKYWAWLAHSLDRLSSNPPTTAAADAFHAWQRALDGLWRVRKESDRIKELKPQSPTAALFRGLVNLRGKMEAEQYQSSGAGNSEKLTRRLVHWQRVGQKLAAAREKARALAQGARAAGFDFACANVAAHLGWLRLNLAELDPTDKSRLTAQAEAAVADLLAAIAPLRAGYPRLVADRGLYGMLASGYRLLEKFDLARHAAEEAIALAPVGVWERLVLASICVQLKDFERAHSELLVATDLGAGEINVRAQFVDSLLQMIVSGTNRVKRREAVEELVRVLEQTVATTDSAFLELCSPGAGYAARAKEIVATDFAQKGWAHFWLGVATAELNDFSASLDHFTIACGCNYFPVESRAQICYAFLQIQAYDHVESAYKKLAEFVPQDAPDHPAMPDRYPRQYLLAWGLVCSVKALVEGMGDLQLAQNRLAEIGRILETDEVRSLGEEVRQSLRGVVVTTEGMLQLARVRRLPGSQPVEKRAALQKAIATLEVAVTIPAANHNLADAFHWLAQAYDEQADLSGPDQEFWRGRAGMARRNRDLQDYRGHYPKHHKPAAHALNKPAAPTA